MDDNVIDLITVSREFGAGGSEFAAALGAHLGWRVFDHDIIEIVARRLKCDRGTVESLDEHAPSFLARVAQSLLIAPIDAPMLLETSGLINPDAVADASRRALLDAADTLPVIIVGHGGQALFAGRRNTLHVRLVAPITKRVDRVCRRAECDDAVASSLVRRMDHARESYVRRYHHIEWNDPLLYDVQINTGRIAIPDAVTLVTALDRFAAGVSAPAVS